jgi:DNA repair ATPase RecN
LLADTKDKEPEEDPKDLKIAELEKERLQLLEVNRQLDERVDEVIGEWKTKVEQIRKTYTDLYEEHEKLKQDFQAKQEEARKFKEELIDYKAQYDERLVQRLNDRIDSLKLDITMQDMRIQEHQDEVAALRQENIKLKTDWELKQVEEVQE